VIFTLTVFNTLYGAAGSNETYTELSIPAHLQRWPGLYVRNGNTIEDAPKEDAAVAMSYPFSSIRGSLMNGRRITIITSTTSVSAGDEVRVIHVMEAPGPGVDVYVMGPKYVYGEYVDGVLRTDPDPEWDNPFVPETYDGAVLPSPAVDYNYEVTSYTFDEPGTHRIQWILYPWKSNVLTVEVSADGAQLSAP